MSGKDSWVLSERLRDMCCVYNFGIKSILLSAIRVDCSTFDADFSPILSGNRGVIADEYRI